jgi:hypothetical protein
VADGKEFLRRNCVPGQGKGKDEKEQWLHFHFVPDLPMLFQFEEGFKDLSAMNAPPNLYGILAENSSGPSIIPITGAGPFVQPFPV